MDETRIASETLSQEARAAIEEFSNLVSVLAALISVERDHEMEIGEAVRQATKRVLWGELIPEKSDLWLRRELIDFIRLCLEDRLAEIAQTLMEVLYPRTEAAADQAS